MVILTVAYRGIIVGVEFYFEHISPSYRPQVICYGDEVFLHCDVCLDIYTFDYVVRGSVILTHIYVDNV